MNVGVVVPRSSPVCRMAWLPCADWLPTADLLPATWHRYGWRVWRCLALGCRRLCSGNILLPTAVLWSAVIPLTITLQLFAAVWPYSAVLRPSAVLWPVAALLLAAVQLLADVWPISQSGGPSV
jgi:hypothetical protein